MPIQNQRPDQNSVYDCPLVEKFCPETPLSLNEEVVTPYPDGINHYGQVLLALKNSLVGTSGAFSLRRIDRKTISETRDFAKNIKLAATNAHTARVAVDKDVECTVESVSIFQSRVICFSDLVGQLEI